MKKLVISALPLLFLVFLGTGCLKDKDYKNQQFGTQVQDSRAVSFPQSRSVSSILYGLVSSLNPDSIKGPFIALEAPNAQSTDTHITLTIDDGLVTADTTHPTILPPDEYTIDLNRTIRAGYTLDSVAIVTLHSANLDPNLTYAIGLRIVNADNGFTVASNISTLELKFGVKNKYDGVYTVTPGIGSTIGGFLDNLSPTYTTTFPQEIRLVTTGAASVDVQRFINNEWAPGYTFLAAGAPTLYGNFGLTMTFDPLTDMIIEAHNYYGDPTKALTVVGDPSLGTGPPDYMAAPPRLRQLMLDPTGVNKWVGSGSTPVVDIKYLQIDATYAGFPNPRVFFDEHWEYTGPRP